MPKEPITNAVFNAVLLRLRAIKAGEKYFCSPVVHEQKINIERHMCPAIVVYQLGDEWANDQGESEACGAVEVLVKQQILICLFHVSPETVNRLKADAEAALFVGGGYLLRQTATDPAVTYRLAGPSGAPPGEGLELGDARFVLTAVYKRAHGSP